MESGVISLESWKSYIFLALYEFLGQIVFLVGINCSQNSAEVCAFGLFIACTLTGRVCGGHFNGAITLGVYLVEGKWVRNLPIAILIWMVDVLGAFTAMGIAVLLLGQENIFTLVPPATV